MSKNKKELVDIDSNTDAFIVKLDFLLNYLFFGKKGAKMEIVREEHNKNINGAFILDHPSSKIKHSIGLVDDNYIRDKDQSLKLYNFVRTLRREFPSYALNNLYDNLYSLEIDNRKRILLLGMGGCYRPLYNQIHISIKGSINHELFHMASSRIENGFVFCGFSFRDIKNNFIIGSFLDEGYTEIMSSRYFNGEIETYKLECFITKKVEEIVGKDKMEIMYLRGDLLALMEELNIYNNSSYSNTLIFIGMLDKLKEQDDKGLKHIDYSLVERVILKLVGMYKSKLLISLGDGIINIDEFKKSLEDYIDDFYDIPFEDFYKHTSIIKPIFDDYKEDAFSEALKLLEGKSL